jgi:hypothetical protein
LKRVPTKPIISTLKLGILIAMSFMLTGCESLIEGLLEDGNSSGGSRSRGVSLSQAMQSSASGSRESLHGSGSRDTHSRDTYSSVDTSADVAVTTGSGSGAAATSGKAEELALQIPMDVAYSIPFNGEFESITRFTLTPLCFENDRYSLGLFISGDIMDLKAGTLAASAIDNTWMLELGIAGRLYLNRAHAFISPYFSANLACQALFWDYRNPVFVDGEEVRSDALPALGGYAGFGVAFNRNSHLSFFGEAGFGGTVFVTQTGQGFDNDVFHDFGYFSVKAGLCIKF